MLHAYRNKWGSLLDENQTFDIVWPPNGYLTTEGQIVHFELCVQHDNEECEEWEEAVGEITPARWTWTVADRNLRVGGQLWRARGHGPVPLPHHVDGSTRCRLHAMTERLSYG